MAISAKLELRQGQQLVMTPQLQQAIRLLQLSNIELVAYVEAELERNPLLERDDRDERIDRLERSETPAGSSGDDDLQPVTTAADGDDDWLDLSRTSTRAEAEQSLDASAESLYPDTSPVDLAGAGDRGPLPGDQSVWSSVRGSGTGGDDDPNLEAYVSGETSLKDHLEAQIHLLLRDPVERVIGQFLLDLVDDTGYIAADLDELAEKLGTTRSTVETVLAKLQTCEPTGVFARGLAECLALQLKEQNRFDPLMEALLANLDKLASHNIAGLRRAVGVDMDELAEMIAELKALDPKPGLRFGSTPIQPIVPDVIVRAAKDGSWLIELNSETLPRVLVNRSYYTRVSSATRSSGDKDYLLDCLQTANWLVKSLDQRARTILRVSEEIVRQQDGFFMYGVQHLRPLNLKTVAEAVSMHESTISRVTSNKYMETPRGIFELKYFFTSAIASAGDGEAHSSEAVRHRIRSLIDAETPDAILSDDQIVDLLLKDGIEIARRTVAKYREAMRIPSSVQRRREKRLASHTQRALAGARAD